MQLTEAKFCVDCEEIFIGNRCPVCGAEDVSVYVQTWIPSIAGRRESFMGDVPVADIGHPTSDIGHPTSGPANPFAPIRAFLAKYGRAFVSGDCDGAR